MWSRRSFLKTTGIVGLLMGSGMIPKFAAAAKYKKQERRITLLHTNDMHSHIEPFPKSDPNYGGMGGFVRLNTLVKKIRSQEKHVLLFDAGDVFQGTPYFNFFKGEVEYRLMSKIGYDAGTLGNHEFDNGIEGISSQIKHLNFPLVNSNYRLTGTSLEGKIEEYKIFVKGGFRVGVFGVGVDLNGLVSSENRGAVAYMDPVETSEIMVEKLRNNHNCNLIVCLSHLGLNNPYGDDCDIHLAKNTKGVDVIIGGHTHTLMENPVFVKNLEGKHVLINQVGWAGIALGRVDIILDAENNIKIADTKNIEVIG